MMPMASSMAPLHSIGQGDQNEVQHDILVMQLHWHQCQQHVILMALSVAQSHSLGQDIQNEIQHYIFGHVIPLALVLVSPHVNVVLNGTIDFLRLRQ